MSVRYNPKLNVAVTATILPLVLKYRPCPSEKKDLFDKVLRYVAARTIKTAYAQNKTRPINHHFPRTSTSYRIKSTLKYGQYNDSE